MKDMHKLLSCIIMFNLFIQLSIATTPDFFSKQPHLFDPDTLHGEPIGLGVWNVRSIPGARGENVNIVDVEHGWHLNHEDLPGNIQVLHGLNEPSDRNHGTATLGLLVGLENTKGIAGICPDAIVSVSSWYPIIVDHETDVTNAINSAIQNLNEGDILLLEVERGNPKRPIESYSMVRNAIVSAINDSIIVIEPAGNGNLDITPYISGYSGAILVASCDPANLTKDPESNFGARVDVNSWGNNINPWGNGVLTTGFGNFYGGNPSSPLDDYGYYGNTSAASALIAGITASLQGIYHAHTGSKLGPNQMRRLLKNSGIKHRNGTDNIGYFPTLPAAVTYMNNLYGLNINYNCVDVSSDQKDSGGNSFGNLSVYRKSQYIEHSAPHNFYFPAGSQQTVKALTEFKPSTVEKFNAWTNISILNHNNFTIFSNQEPLEAQFQNTINATIKTDLISAGGISAGNMGLVDPWYWEESNATYFDDPYGYRNLGMTDPEHFINIGANKNISTASEFKGVFKNQDVLPNSPYYSVRTPATIDHEGRTYTFDGWQTDNATIAQQWQQSGNYYQSPVIFTGDNSEVSAIYKAHMVSGKQNATGHNNGRRMVVDGDGDWHLVYEDGGNIYYTTSANGGQSWSSEARLNDTDYLGVNSSPSICYAADQLAVVWNRKLDRSPQPDDHFPVLRKRHLLSNWSDEIFANPEEEVYAHEDCTPVITNANFYNYRAFYILCKVDHDTNPAKRGIGLLEIEDVSDLNTEMEWISKIPDTEEHSKYPAVSALCGNSAGSKIHIAWEDSNMIFYRNFNGEGFTREEGVSYPLEPGQSNHNPSISHDADNRVNVVWEFNGGSGNTKFEHRQRDAEGNWSAIQMIQSYEDLSVPTAGSFIYPEGKNYYALNFGEDVRLLERYNGWRWHSFQENGVYPNLNVWGETLVMAWTDPSDGLPYTLEQEEFSSEEDEKTIGGEFIVSEARREQFALDSLNTITSGGNVNIQIGEITLASDSGNIKWPFIKMPNRIMPTAYLRTEPIKISADMKFLTAKLDVQLDKFSLKNTSPAQKLFNFEVIDAVT